jgi:GntR family transcriptional regulator
MRMAIDVTDPVPVFTQLIAQIREAVRSGTLKSGTPLPPIRQLAADLQINPNTVAKAYRLLERDGVIETRGRHGSFVHSDAKRRSKVDLASQAASTLTDTIARLRESGLTDSEIRIAFAAVMRAS